VIVRDGSLTKTCKFDSRKACLHASCSIFDPVSGSVSLCPLYRGGDFFSRRKVAPSIVVPLFCKHRKGGS
jgi:hypothetical protein